jgi:hypothetical protein
MGLPAGRNLAGRSRGLTLQPEPPEGWRGVVTGWTVGAVAGRVARKITHKSDQLVAEVCLYVEFNRKSGQISLISAP